MEKIAASILSQKNIPELITKLISKGIKMIHYDVLDGQFLKAKFLNQNELFDILKNTPQHLVDIHLMVKEPLKKIQKFAKIADYISFHLEVTTIDEILKILKKFSQLKIGIAINPQTPIDKLIPILPLLSHVLIMSVEPGKGAQSFMKIVLKKIQKLKKIITKNNYQTLIQVDGGINLKYAKICKRYHVDSLVSGSFLVAKMDEQKTITKLKK